MAEHGHGSCCRCCSSFLLTLGLTALSMWLSLRTSSPTFSIQHFYVPDLNLTNISPTNRTIFFDLNLQNQMNDKGVHYANTTLTVFYNFTLLVGNYTVPGFYQGHKKKAHRRVAVEATGLPWAAAMEAVVNGSTVGFRVGLAARVKFKILFWYTGRHSLMVAGNVAVDGSGQKVGKKGVKLKSAAPDPGTHLMSLGPGFVSALLIILF